MLVYEYVEINASFDPQLWCKLFVGIIQSEAPTEILMYIGWWIHNGFMGEGIWQYECSGG